MNLYGESWFPRFHKVTLRGETVRFWSCYKRGTVGLHGDAIQALKDAGLYERASDAKEMRVW